jgi:multiple sugar transport system substrate-binding protein
MVLQRQVGRRRSLGIAATALLLAITTSSVGLTASESPEAEGEPQTLTIGMWPGLVDQFTGYAEAFEEAHPGFSVSVDPVPLVQADYIQQLVTQGLSNSTPDIVFNYDTLNQSLVGAGVVYDMAPSLMEGRGGLTVDTFLPNFLAQYRVGDKITGMPVSADAALLFYNKSVFDTYGVDYPTPDWTYDDMYSAAIEITEKSNGEVFGLATPLRDGTAFFTFYPVLKASGSNLFDPASERFVFADSEGLAAWNQLMRPYQEGFGTPFSAATQYTQYMNSGQAAMAVISTADVEPLRNSMTDDWDVQQLPTVEGNAASGGGSYSLSISESSPNKDAAWTFLSWFYDTDGGMAAAAPNGVIPATVDGVSNGSWLTTAPPVPANFVPATQYAVANATLPDPIPDAVQPQVAPALKAALEGVIVGGQSIEEAYGAAQEELNGELGVD